MATVPQLQWNIVGPRDYYQGLQTVEGYLRTINELITASSYWRTISLDLTGSSSGAIVLAPKVGLALEDMRVVFATGFPDANNNIVLSRNQIGTLFDVYAATTMYVGITPDASSSYAGNWYTGEPFGVTGSSNLWSKYWPFATITDSQIMFIIESQESLALFTTAPANATVYGGIIGAILLGYDAQSSDEGRLYGMAVSNEAGISATFWASTTTFLGHSDSDGAAHTGIFSVIDGVTQNSFKRIEKQSAISLSAQYPGETTTSNGTMTGIGCHMVDQNDSAVGFWRQIYAYQDKYTSIPLFVFSGSLNKIESVPVGVIYSAGNSAIAAGDAILFISTGSQNNT